MLSALERVAAWLRGCVAAWEERWLLRDAVNLRSRSCILSSPLKMLNVNAPLLGIAKYQRSRVLLLSATLRRASHRISALVHSQPLI